MNYWLRRKQLIADYLTKLILNIIDLELERDAFVNGIDKDGWITWQPDPLSEIERTQLDLAVQEFAEAMVTKFLQEQRH